MLTEIQRDSFYKRYWTVEFENGDRDVIEGKSALLSALQIDASETCHGQIDVLREVKQPQHGWIIQYSET